MQFASTPLPVPVNNSNPRKSQSQTEEDDDDTLVNTNMQQCIVVLQQLNDSVLEALEDSGFTSTSRKIATTKSKPRTTTLTNVKISIKINLSDFTQSSSVASNDKAPRNASTHQIRKTAKYFLSYLR